MVMQYMGNIYYPCWSTLGHGINANIHKAITFTIGTKEIKENHPEKPALTKIFPISHTGTIIIKSITAIMSSSGNPIPIIENPF